MTASAVLTPMLLENRLFKRGELLLITYVLCRNRALLPIRLSIACRLELVLQVFHPDNSIVERILIPSPAARRTRLIESSAEKAWFRLTVT